MKRARELLEAARQAHREVGNRRSEGIALSNLAALDRDEGRPLDAIARWREAVAIHREVGDRKQMATTSGNLAVVLVSLGHHDEAEDHLTRALAVHRETGNRRSEAITLMNFASLRRAQGRCDAARALFADAAAAARQSGAVRVEGAALAHLARLDADAADPRTALDRAGRAAEILRHAGDTAYRAMAQAIRTRALAALGDRDGAFAALDEAAALAPEGHPDADACLAEARAVLDLAPE